MPKYLSQEWLDEGRKLAESQPDRPGASARMQYVVTGGPDGDIKYYWVLENGKLLESKLGEISDADFTLTLTYDDSVKVQKGELDANAAFMQGRQHGQAHAAHAAHELARVQGAPGAGPRHHRVLSRIWFGVARPDLRRSSDAKIVSEGGQSGSLALRKTRLTRAPALA
jgi:SCP-2 sterol transfer family